VATKLVTYARERERITIDEARPLIGLPIRTVQSMASKGEIPGAAKMRRRWTFDLVKLEDWIAHKERETWQNAQKPPADVSGEEAPYGLTSGFAVTESSGHLKRLIRRLRNRELPPSKRGRTPKSSATHSGRSVKPSRPGEIVSIGKSPTRL
jgi:hypothetical protein